MKIITYRELANNDDILMLWIKSFGQAVTSKWLNDFIKYDSRLADGPIGMCAIKNGKLVSIVGIMIIPTRTKNGDIEKVGGIYGVTTRPSHARQGIGRKLLDQSEQYLRERGYKFSFLTTSKTIIAYKWYRDVGYEDIIAVNKLPHMYKVFRKPNIKSGKSSGPRSRFSFNKAQALFDRYIANRCGFTIRDKLQLQSHSMQGFFSPRHSIILDDGYALAGSNSNCILIREIIAGNQKTYRSLIKSAEAKAKYAVVANHVFDNNAQKAFKAANYSQDYGHFATMMCKPLGKYKFSDLYDKSFTISRLDWF